MSICAQLFQTTPAYQSLLSIEATKADKNRDKTQEEITLIESEINAIFIETLQKLLDTPPILNQRDLLFCTLSYLEASSNAIKICMGAESNAALFQRKHRIKQGVEHRIFSLIFKSKKEQ